MNHIGLIAWSAKACGRAAADYGERVRRDASDKSLGIAFLCALVGGAVVTAAYLVALPRLLILAAWASFVASVASTLSMTVFLSRAEGIGFPRALVRGIRAALAWVFWFLP